MPMQDDWGQDPSVQRLRRVFASMETVQEELLNRLNLSPYDKRLRKFRQKALVLFERAFTLAAKRGVVMSEENAASVYLHCLGQALRSDGIEVPHEALADDAGIIDSLLETKP